MTTLTADRHRSPALLIITGIVAVWFGTVFWLTTSGVFHVTGGGLPLTLIAAVAIPPLLFLLADRTIPAVRAWIAGLDLALVTAAQTWRVIGLAFLLLWGLGQLPAPFALAAGLGDVAVGAFAVLVTVQVARRSDGWRRNSSLLIVVGLLDFVGAIGSAILTDPGRLLAFEGQPTADLMEVFPMALIPAFGVPVFIILHLIAWLKLHREA